ncbi:MAG TPA: hypothetical protein VGQ34_02245 [Sphingomicrobium sp.]|nr:hypothetical protein [Sphingomicrobium sp.]
MSARSFGSLFMVASCAGAALGCYLVSLRVASERAALENVETRIVSTQGELRMIQTEIGTRGRLSQLERWNAGAFALSAPAANQFVGGSFELAKLVQPEKQINFQAPVVLASAPAPEPQKPLEQAEADNSSPPAAAPSNVLLHEASLKTETREVPARPAVAMPQQAVMKSADKPATADKPVQSKSTDKPGLAAAQPKSAKLAKSPRSPAAKDTPLRIADAARAKQKKSVDKAALVAEKPMTKRVEIAKTDPLAPLPVKHSGKTKDSPAGR